MTTTIRTWLLAVCTLALGAGMAQANNPKWSDDELARFSDAIVTGRVGDISAGRDRITNNIYTYVTIVIDEALKGDIPERSIVIKQLGGTIGNDGLSVGDQASFTRGEDVLLFLETRPRDKTLYTSALWQGKWTLDRDGVTGERIATRRSPVASARGALGGEPDRRSLAALMSRLRTAGSGAERPFVVEPSAEETRAAVRAATVGVGAPYAFLGPYRWNEFDSNTPIPMDMAPGGQPGLSDGGASGLVRATQIWSGPTGLRFSAGGGPGHCSNTGSGDGHISVVFDDPCAEISNSGGTLAFGGAYFTSSGGRTVNGTAFSRAVSGFIVNNDGTTATNYLQNASCFASIDTHELGHVLGLDHSADSSAIMYAFINNSCFSAAIPISADDTAGIRAIYPPANTPTPTAAPGAPTGFTATSSGSTVTLTWTAPPTGGTPTAYIIEAGSAPGLANLANFSTGNTATSFSTSGVGAGTYYVRVRATNGSGTSGTSNEATLVVGGGCSGPPPAPSGFANTFKSNGTVSFVWNASATATTYIIEAGSIPGATNLANANLGSSATSATFNGVPNGTYYVRLRAQNACGASGVSNEVTLILP